MDGIEINSQARVIGLRKQFCDLTANNITHLTDERNIDKNVEHPKSIVVDFTQGERAKTMRRRSMVGQTLLNSPSY